MRAAASVDVNNLAASIDNLLELTSPAHQCRCLLVLGLCNSCHAVQMMSVCFVLPRLTGASRQQKECLAAALFVGMLGGSSSSAWLSKRFGRKGLLQVCFLGQAMAGIVGAMSPCRHVDMFLACRCLTGFFVGSADPAIWSLAAELISPSLRKKYISIISIFFLVGSVSVAVIAWTSIQMLGLSWQKYYLITSCLPLATFTSLRFLPESPQYFIEKGDSEGLAKTLQALTTELPAPELCNRASGFIAAREIDIVRRVEQQDTSRGGPASTLSISAICFAVAYVFFGVSTIVISVFTDMGITDPYFASIAFSAVGALGELPAVYLVNAYGPQLPLLGSLLASAVASGIVALGFQGSLGVFVACALSACMTMAYNAMMTYNASAPLKDRVSSLAIFAQAMRLGSISAQFVNGELSENVGMWLVHNVNLVILLAAAAVVTTLQGLSPPSSGSCDLCDTLL